MFTGYVELCGCSAGICFETDHALFESASTGINMSADCKTREGIQILPDEVVVKILSYVPHDDDFKSVRLANRRLNDLSYVDSFRRQVSFLHFVMCPKFLSIRYIG